MMKDVVFLGAVLTATVVTGAIADSYLSVAQTVPLALSVGVALGLVSLLAMSSFRSAQSFGRASAQRRVGDPRRGRVSVTQTSSVNDMTARRFRFRA